MRIMMKKTGSGSIPSTFSEKAVVNEIGSNNVAFNDNYIVSGMTGQVEVYERSSGNYFTIYGNSYGNTQSSGSFGTGVAISPNSDIITVTDQHDHTAGSNTGAVIIYSLSGQTASIVSKFTNPSPQYVTMTGIAAISESKIIVPHYYYGPRNGRVYILNYSGGVVSTIDAPAVYTTYTYFGNSVDWSEENDVLHVSTGSGGSNPRVYRFDISGNPIQLGFCSTQYGEAYSLKASANYYVTHNVPANPNTYTVHDHSGNILWQLDTQQTSNRLYNFEITDQYTILGFNNSWKVYETPTGQLVAEMDTASGNRCYIHKNELLIGNKIYHL